MGEHYLRNGIKGLYDRTRTGKLKKYPPDLKVRIGKLIETDPPQVMLYGMLPL